MLNHSLNIYCKHGLQYIHKGSFTGTIFTDNDIHLMIKGTFSSQPPPKSINHNSINFKHLINLYSLLSYHKNKMACRKLYNKQPKIPTFQKTAS